MTFLVRPGAHARARPPVRAFLVFTVLAMAAAIVQRALGGGLSAAGLEELLLPDAEAPGGLLASMQLWEQVHTNGFLHGFLLFTLSSLLAVCPVAPALRGGLLAAAAAAALLDLGVPFLAFRLPGWAHLRVGAFVALHICFLGYVVAAWLTFGKPARHA